MAKTNNMIFFIIPALFVLISVWLLFSFQTQESSKTKIGIILPLTGNTASLGAAAKNGANLAFQDISEKEKQKLLLFFEDDQFDPKNTLTIFFKLVGIDQVNVIICFTSSPCNAIAPLAEEKKIPTIAIASDSKIQKNKKFVFRLEIAPNEEAKLLVNYIEKQNFKRLASIVAIHDGIQAGYDELSKYPRFADIEVFKENVQPSEKDFRTVLNKAFSTKPDIIFVGLLPGQAGELGKQAKDFGYSGKFIGLNFLESEETLTSAQGSLEGIIYTNTMESQGWFNKKFKKAFNKNPSSGAAHAYDAITLIAKAISENKKTSKEIVEYLSSIKDYNGALGLFSATNTHEFSLPVTLKTIKNNEFVEVELTS